MKCAETVSVLAIVLKLLIEPFLLATAFTYPEFNLPKTLLDKTVSASTSRSMDNELRVQLCPNLAENVANPYRFDKITNKCYRVGDKGPCGDKMIFFSESESSAYGLCDCDTRSHERALVFHPNTDRCYFVFSQAYCPANKWLVFNDMDIPACVRNRCSNSRITANRDYVLFRGQCKELGSKAAECGPKEVITFVRDKLYPVCGVKLTDGITSFSLTVPKLRCSPGSAQSILGRCKPIVKYDFS